MHQLIFCHYIERTVTSAMQPATPNVPVSHNAHLLLGNKNTTSTDNKGTGDGPWRHVYRAATGNRQTVCSLRHTSTLHHDARPHSAAFS